MRDHYGPSVFSRTRTFQIMPILKNVHEMFGLNTLTEEEWR
jgi:hypothetical protein